VVVLTLLVEPVNFLHLEIHPHELNTALPDLNGLDGMDQSGANEVQLDNHLQERHAILPDHSSSKQHAINEIGSSFVISTTDTTPFQEDPST
jgi:hypothetical protein